MHLRPSSVTATNVNAVAGKLNRAATFPASAAGYIYAPDFAFAAYGNDDWAISFWFYSTDLGAFAPLCGHYASSGSQRAWYLGIDWASSNKLLADISHDGGTPMTRVLSTGVATSAAWNFCYFAHDGANDLLLLSVNGEAANTAAHSTGVHATTAPFKLGQVDTASYFDGRMESASYWYGSGAIKSTAEIAALYAGGYGNPFIEGR